MAKKTITCCDRCGKQVTGKQAFTVRHHLLTDVDGVKLFQQPGYTEAMRTRSELASEITLCRTCIYGMLEEPRVTRTTKRDPYEGMSEKEIHDAYGDPGPGPWEPTEENGGRGGPGDR